MSLKLVAIVGALAGVAAVMMFITAPIAGLITGIISVVLDSLLGSKWQGVPIVDLAPFAITYLIYFVLLVIGCGVLLKRTRQPISGHNLSTEIEEKP